MLFVYDVNREAIVDPLSNVSIGRLIFGLIGRMWGAVQLESTLSMLAMAPFGYKLITGKDSNSLLFRRFVSGPLYNKLFTKNGLFADIELFNVAAGDLDQSWSGFNKKVIANLARFSEIVHALNTDLMKLDDLYLRLKTGNVDDLINGANLVDNEAEAARRLIQRIQLSEKPMSASTFKFLYGWSRVMTPILSVASAITALHAHPLVLGLQFGSMLVQFGLERQKQIEKLNYYRRLLNITGLVPVRHGLLFDLPYTRAEEYVLRKSVEHSMVTLQMLSSNNLFGENPYLRFYA